MFRHSSPGTLLDIIQQARSRWRMKLALRGVLRVVAIALALLLVAAYGLDWARFTPTSILVARVALFVALLAAVAWFLVLPLRRKVSDEQVALYLEEHEPSLQATLLSAVEASQNGNPQSAALVRRVVEQAIERCANIDAARRVERMPLRRNGVALAGMALVAIAIVTLGPAFIRNAVSALLLVQRDVEAAVPYRIEVKPGNATVPKGADQTIVATLKGFGSEDVVVMGKRAPTSAFEPIPLARNEDGTYEGILFDVSAPLEYYILADGVQSERYTLRVVDLPYVQQLNLEYRFPAYTGLEAQKVEDGGDIAVLRGTDVHVQITPTMKTTGGRLLVNDKSTIELTPQPDGTLTANFKADADGFYRVELNSPNGEKVAASPQYTIDVLTDGAPAVSFKRPGRDTSVSPIEEVFVEANADDDYGVRNLELVYSVNGGAEKVVKLFDGGGRRLPEVTAGHTFYLEELGVQPGDAVSYYARAADNDAVSGAKDASSDIYFLRVRPLNKNFRQAQSAGGGGGGGGGGGQQIEALSDQQKQIISATHNVQRDRKKMTADKLRQNSTVVSLSQSKLREQVEGLLTRMNSQLVQRDPAFQKIAEMLPQAVTAMKEAEAKLNAVAPDQALQAENKALQILQKAEEEYEVQVSAQQQQGGGGGGGGGQQQRDLAELFEQDLDKMASRYETANQQSQEQGEREVDELLEKLKELARRQEQEAERQRRRALEGQMAGGGNSGAQQRALADQVEEEARRLERLAREEQRQDLADAARQMQDAANAMRRAAAGGDASAQAQAQAALERLRETERRLQRTLSDRTKGDIDDAQRAAEQIAQQQQEISDGTKQLASAADAAARQRQARQLSDKEDQLHSQLVQLEQQLARAARDASKDEKAAARKLTEAADAIRGNQLPERVRQAGNMINYGGRASAAQALASAQNDITKGIDELRRRIDEAEAALGQGNDAQADARQRALDSARGLARGTESMAERTRERAMRGRNGQGQDGQQQNQQGQNGQRGQQGQQGQNGEQGQQGQQAQNGQRGQQGQQGQNGQQGQQGQNGQRGQQGQQGQGGQQGQQGQQGQGQGQGQAQNGQQGGQGGGGGRTNDGNLDGRAGEFGGVDRGGNRGDQFGYGWGGWWNGQPVNLSDEDIRQLSREARQYADDLQRLRGQLTNDDLRGAEIDPRQLEQMTRALRDLQDPRVYKDVAELARLQAFVAETAKRVDFALRREAVEQNAVAISGSDEVPDGFREEVAEYYRSLARTPQK